MACSLENTRKLFQKEGILNKFDQLTEDTGANVTKFNQLAYKVKQLGIAKYGELPEGGKTPIKLDGKKAVFNRVFFDWVDRKNNESKKLSAISVIKPGVVELFDSYPELASIGTPEQYSQYLDTIFTSGTLVYKGVNEKNNFNKWFALDKFYAAKWGFPIPHFINTAEVFNISNFEKYFDKPSYIRARLVMGQLSIDSKFKSELKLLELDNPKAATEFLQSFEKSSVISGPEAGFENNISFYVKNIDDAHKLGDSKDIEGFKKFVKNIQTLPDFNSIFFQLTDTTKLEKNDAELDAFLLDFLTSFGVKTEQLDEIKERFGADALGVTDVLNKLIYYAGNRNIETIPEEFGHMISFLMGPNHPLMKQLLEDINKWEEFADIWKEYYPKYNYNGAKVRLEAVGKLIAKRLVAQYKESKTAPKTGLNALADRIIKIVMDFFNKVFNSGYSSLFLADKIAAEVLMGNKNFVYQGYQDLRQKVSKFTAVDFNKSVADNPLAQSIIKEYGDAFGNLLAGSLAVAGQNEKILRSPEEQIHDLDFVVRSEDAFQAVVGKLGKNNAVPIHNGWANTNKSYTTYSYLLVPEGHTVEVLERNSDGWIAKDKDNNYKVIIRNANNKVIAASPKTLMAVDFFVYPNQAPFKENSIDNKFSSWQDIFFGKLSLSPRGDNEIMFQRDKDQMDYIMNNPVQRTFKPNPAFLFFQLDSNKNTVDNSALEEKEKLEALRIKQLQSQINRKKELQAISGKENRLEVQSRLKIINASIEELESSASIAKFFNVAFYDIAAAQSILNKEDKDVTAFDLNEVVRILSVLEGFDITMADIITAPEEKKYVIAIRNKIAELTPKFNKKLAVVIERIGKAQGFDMTYAQITKAVEDLNKTSSLLYSPEESNIPILRILASVLNEHEADVREDRAEFMQKFEEIASKYKNFDYSTILENGHLILPYLEEYYEQEAALHNDIKEVRDQLRELYKSKEPSKKFKAKNLYEKLEALQNKMYMWYVQNNTYYLTPEMEREYENDVKVKRESLTDPITGEVDEEAFAKFEKEHSPYKNGAGRLSKETVEVDGKIYKVFNVVSEFMPEGRWYRYLTPIPKTEGKVNWSNPKYEQIKDNELYKFIVESLSESISKVPHDLYSETIGPHKILRKIMYDATSNSFALRTWGADTLDTIKNWWSRELTASDIEQNYKGVTDASGREKATIQAPKIQDVKGAKSPLELAKSFFELAAEYDNATKVVPVTDLLQYTLSQMSALRTNSITGKMYETIIKGAESAPEVVERGLINAMKSARYKTDSVLSKKTRLDEQNIDITEEEAADLRKRETEWVKSGMKGPRPTIRKTSSVAVFDAITDYTRLNLIGLKPFTAAANILMGISANFIHAARKKDFEDKHLFKATKIVFESMFKFTRDKGASSNAVKLALLAEKFGVVLNLFEGQERGDTQIARAVNKLMYLMQERGEYTIHTQLMLAMMYAKQVTDKNGKERNLWDAFVLEKDAAGNRYLAWNEKEFGTQELWQNRQVFDAEGLNISNLKKFEADLRRVRIATQGDYQNALLGKAQWYGRMGFLFRTWLPSAIRQRFGKEIEGEFKGRYRTWSQYAKSSYKKDGFVGFFGSSLKTAAFVATKTFITSPLSVLGLKSLSKGLNQSYEESLKSLGLSELDVENMRANVRELQMILFFAIIAGALKQLADDDDDPELTFLINLSQRLHQDLTFFMNPDSAMAVIKDPIPTWKVFQDVTDVITAISNRIEDPEKDIYQRGRYKGQSKTSKELIDLFPGWSGLRSTIAMGDQQFNSQTYKFK